MNEFESDFHSNVSSRYSSVIVSKVDFSEWLVPFMYGFIPSTSLQNNHDGISAEIGAEVIHLVS